MHMRVVTDEIARVEEQFGIEIVDTPEQTREVFRLRHQVYCVERGYEPGVDDQETDEFDARSRHVLLRHVGDGTVVGTVRIIMPNLSDLHDSFPMQRLCDPWLLRDLPLRTTGEMSRFALSKQRRTGFSQAVLLRLSLWRGILQLSGGLTHWLAIVEPSNLRLHAKHSICFDSVGPLVSYHGVRQPTVGVIGPVLERIRREAFPVWNFITDGGRLLPRENRALGDAPSMASGVWPDVANRLREKMAASLERV
jgi:N-acyl-L-homoserine lactone synthetase